jgi:mannitol-1-phosphate/altronate dehydrogenase
MSEPTALESEQPFPRHVHIGAGSFGLGMVVEVCHRAGLSSAVLNRISRKKYHESLQQNQSYEVVFDDTPDKRIELAPRFYCYENGNEPEVLRLLAHPNLELITTSVTQDGLKGVAPLLARTLQDRAKAGCGNICIMACENLPQNSTKLKQYVEAALPAKRKHLLAEVFFCDTLVDRVCALISCPRGIVEVPAESFHSWIVNAPPSPVSALDLLKENHLIRIAGELEFKAHETQKYWCLNGIHLATAAYAYNHEKSLLHFHDALAVPSIAQKIQALQQELGLAFLLYINNSGVKEYFSEKMISDYNDQVFYRLQTNRTDTIGRVLKQQSEPGDAAIGVLNRIERLIAPQCEILAKRKGLIHPKLETVALHHQIGRRYNGRLELDDAITQVILAMRNFARDYPGQ